MLHGEEKITTEDNTAESSNRKSDLRKGYTAAVLFSVLVGFSFLAVKICQMSTDSVKVLCYRYDFAFAALVILLACRVIKVDIRHKPKGKLMLTAVFYVGFMALQVIGLMFATSVEGAIIFAMIPILVKIIASLFLKERATWQENIFVCLTVLALLVMIIMGTTDVTIDPIGTVLLILSSIAMALSNVFMRYARHDYRPAEITTTIVIMGVIAFNIAAVVTGIINGESPADYFRPLADPSVFISGAYLGIGCILLSAYIMSYMLSKMEAVNATIFGNVSTAISIVAGVIVLGEPLMWYHIVCTVLIIAGVVGMSLCGMKRS